MEKFNYTYSAPTETERKEIENIKKRYETPTGESKFERLRRLDAKVKNGVLVWRTSFFAGVMYCHTDQVNVVNAWSVSLTNKA